MTGQSREEQFEAAEIEYSSEEDVEILRANKEAYITSRELSMLEGSPGGRILIKTLRDDITKSLSLLIETRQGRYLSDLESSLNLLTKLTGAKNQTDSIGKWLDTLN